MSYLRKVLAIVWKDVRAELRTKDILSSMLVFAGLSVLIFQFAFDLRADNVRLVLPGVLWIAITFAGVLGLNRSFILEQDRGSLEGLLLAPVDRSAIYFGKLIGNLLFIFIVELLLLPLMTVLFNVWLLSPALLLVVALGTVGYAAVGTLFAALSINTRAREVMLPILLFPVMVPVFVAGVQAVSRLLDGDSLADIVRWVQLLVAILERYGFVERRKAEDDLRITLITPTPKLWGADALYHEAFYGPFRRLAARDGVALPEAGPRTDESGAEAGFDPQAPAWTNRDLAAAGAGHRHWHRAQAPRLDQLFALRAGHGAFQQIVARDGGYLVLLLALEQTDRTGSTRLSLPYETVSSHTGVSRTHARQLVEQAEALGFLTLLSKGGREVEATEALFDAADRWFADHAAFQSTLID